MNGGPHFYKELSLSTTGTILGLAMVALYGVMYFKPEPAMVWAKKLPRHYQAGIYTMALGMIWFWLLVAPSDSVLGKLSMPLAEFSAMKPYLQLGVPLACVGMIMYVKEFLFVRGLGLCFLMAAAPLLYSAFLKDPASRLLVPLVAYAMIIKGLFFVGMPYTFRDGVNWLTASMGRWKAFSLFGFILGILILGCALTVWREY